MSNMSNLYKTSFGYGQVESHILSSCSNDPEIACTSTRQLKTEVEPTREKSLNCPEF